MNKKETAAPQLWERQPKEGPQAFKAFAAYRDSGINGARRSLTRTAQNLTKRDGTHYSDGTLKVWSQRWHWQERVKAFDEYMDKQIRDELSKGITNMLKKHVDIAQAMLVKALKALQSIPETELNAQDITKMVDIASKLERISRGESTERTEGTRTVTGEVQAHATLNTYNTDLSGLSDEELEKLNELVGKLAAE